MRNWMPPSSVAAAMAPPSASTSLHQVPLADATDRRVARHLPQSLDVVRQQQCLAPHAGRSQRRLGAGMAATDDDNVKNIRELHGFCACANSAEKALMILQMRDGCQVNSGCFTWNIAPISNASSFDWPPVLDKTSYWKLAILIDNAVIQLFL